MAHRTKLPGVPDREDIIPGMAYIAGTGPPGKTCGDCWYRWLTRVSANGVEYRVPECQLFLAYNGGKHGRRISRNNRSCKYFEPKEKGNEEV